MPRRTNDRRARDTAGRGRGGGRRQRPKDVRHRPGGERGDAFRCVGCRLDVPLTAPGTAHRNHCPHCLASRHVDRSTPGDRESRCRGRMTALGLSVHENGEWQLIHSCEVCGALKPNRIAGDDNALALIRLALRPLADPRLRDRALLAL
ncbi:RNHCP domain-containing protein [Streptomyces sp. XM4193]|uniref:RNHCP domain-containing protein n=1 Tax=Streptomyces sp. XM4193 TaxID=2929782 RepID=UPI001FF9985A|nr:RNHCP domain-containing protein [Streptomyces sp. XM4193]MCK1798208.1 RNHCP domain-containing protein [Streptomyces sp. XM4193]